MKHNNLIKIIVFLLSFCLLDGYVKANDIPEANDTYGYHDIAKNYSKPNENTFNYCDNCDYVTPDWNAGASTVQLTTADGSQVGFTVCSTLTASKVGAQNCDVISDDIPNPLNDDGSTNQDYSKYWNEYLDKAIEDGELNTKSEAGRMVAAAFCKNGETTSECSEKIKNMVAESADDNMDFNVYPGQTICVNGGECDIINALNADLCGGNFPGVNQVLCKNVAEACISGSGTNYQSNNYSKGTAGLCTYDSFAELLNQTCEGQCAYSCAKATSSNTVICYQNCVKARCEELEEEEPKPDPEPPEPKKCKQYTCEELYGTAGCTTKTQVLPETVEIPASCGVNYYRKSYELGGKVDSCGTTDYIIETTVTINVPSRLNSVVYAGQGFNWGGFNGKATVTTQVGNTSNLVVERNLINTELANVEKKIACKKKEAADEYSEAQKSCGESMGTCMQNCMKDCEGEKCTEQSKKCSQSCGETVSNCQKNAKDNYDKQMEKIEEEEENLKKPYNDALDQLYACQVEISSASTKTETYGNSYFSESAATMTIGSYKQIAGSIKSIIKNSGFPDSTSATNNSFVNEHDFFIPYYIPNNMLGTLSQSVSSQFGSASVYCPFSVRSTFTSPSGNINLIYRPISLVNPFPSSSYNDSRKTIGYWSEGVINMIIHNNREVSNYEVYNLVPMYTITLTPSDIKEIREYNKQNSYSDFNLECVDGLYCRSNFLWEEFNHLINNDKSCAMDSDWYACDSEYYAGARDELLKKLK